MAKWNVFNGGKSRARVRAAIARLEALKYEKLAQTREIEIEIERSYHKREAAKLNKGISKKRIALANESYRIIRAQYQQGLKTTMDLLGSETQLKKARLGYITAENRLLLEQSKLDLALGRDKTSVMEIAK